MEGWWVYRMEEVESLLYPLGPVGVSRDIYPISFRILRWIFGSERRLRRTDQEDGYEQNPYIIYTNTEK